MRLFLIEKNGLILDAQCVINCDHRNHVNFLVDVLSIKSTLNDPNIPLFENEHSWDFDDGPDDDDNLDFKVKQQVNSE